MTERDFRHYTNIFGLFSKHHCDSRCARYLWDASGHIQHHVNRVHRGIALKCMGVVLMLHGVFFNVKSHINR